MQTNPNLKAIPGLTPHRQALALMRENLMRAFIDRDSEITGCMVGMITGNPVFLYGPPGTGKSLLIETMCKMVSGTVDFRWLMSAFTAPEELMGPVSVKGLQMDTMRRNCAHKLPEAHFVFLDEVFKGNSAILNTLLTVLNEGIHFNPGPMPVEARVILGASNEIPSDPSLGALYDRFPLRYDVRYVAQQDRRRLLTLTGATPAPVMDLATLDHIRSEVGQVSIPDATVTAFLTLWDKLDDEGFTLSDRRMRKTLHSVLRGYAYLQGDPEVTEDHFEIMGDTLWDKPEDRDTIRKIVATVGNPLNIRATEIMDAAKERVSDLGLCPSGEDAKATWLGDASKVRSSLTSMMAELNTLKAANPGKNLNRVNTAGSRISKMSADIAQRVSTAYGL